jgi:hypothetical protein
MRRLPVVFSFLLGLLQLWTPRAAEAQSLSFPELSPLPVASVLAHSDEPLPLDTLIDSALVLSGTPEASMGPVRQLLQRHVEDFRVETTGIADERRLGEAALEYLFRNVIKTYSLMEARVNVALGTGVYNCVSSTVLYMILARSVGLVVSGVRTSDHAFCTVTVNDSPLDVETTTPYGFDPGTKKEFKDAFGKVTGFSYVPPSNYRDRKPVRDKELLALIPYDRASMEIQSGNYQAAVQPLATAYSMVASEEFLRAMSISISDWAAFLGINSQFDTALTLLKDAKAAYGSNIELDRRMSDVYYNNILSLVEKNALQDAESRLGNSPRDTPLDDASWMDLSVLLLQTRSENAAKSGGYAEAAAIVSQAIEKLGRDSRLLHMYEVYVHNQFATLYNSRRYADAKDVLTMAINVYPASQTFSQDLSAVQKALVQ